MRTRLYGVLKGWRTDRGSISLEYVVLTPVLLLLIFTIVQVAFWYHGRDVALAAAQQGARAAREHNGGSAAKGADAARAFIERAGGSKVIENAAVTPQRTATDVTVTVTGNVMTLVPGLRLPISQTASLPVERFNDLP